MSRLLDDRSAYVYDWPREDSITAERWSPQVGGSFIGRSLPEDRGELAGDSRWPGFFPSPIALVTASDGQTEVLERVVGPSIVNRFPYVLALSVCTKPLSDRHYVRRRFSEVLESAGRAALQLLQPGTALDRTLDAIAEVPDDAVEERFERAGLERRSVLAGSAPLFQESYLVYEGKLLEGDLPAWRDVGSHRVYFLEVDRIELREDIARGRSQIHWRSLPTWHSRLDVEAPEHNRANLPEGKYTKGYNADYRFPSTSTVGFEHDEVRDGMAVRHLPTGVRAHEQVEVDDDRARWPCFFPSSVGMITTWIDGEPNLMPCGSTTVVSRHPRVVAPSISYGEINVRYAPRHTISVLRQTRRFTCGVPYLDSELIEALAYAGNVSFLENKSKVRDAGFAIEPEEWAPLLPALPVSYECEVVGEQELGTHSMIFGEVKRVLVRADVTPDNPLAWCPWPAVEPADG